MFMLAVVSVLLGSFGQLLLKTGARNFEPGFAWSDYARSLRLVAVNTPILLGLLLYGASFLLWVKVLTRLELSYAYPLTSIGYIVVAVGSSLFLGENVTLQRLLGISLIAFGVIVAAKS